MTSREKKSRKKYFKGLFIFIIVLLVLGGLLLAAEWIFAKEYEESQIDNVINKYIVNLNENRWNDKIAEASKSLVNEFQNEQDIKNTVQTFLKTGTITYQSAGIGDVVRYDIYSNGIKIGTTGFSEDKTKETYFKMYPWKLVEEQYSFEFLRNEDPFILEIPSDFILKLNGNVVGKDYITEIDIEYDCLQPLYSEVKGLPTKVRYEASNLAGEVKYEVFDPDNKPFSIDEFKSDIQYTKECSQEEQALMQNFMESGFVEAYVKFWGTKWVDTTYPTLMQYVRLNSKLHQEMYTYTLDAVTWIHYYQCNVNSMHFNYAKALGGGAYVVSETVDSTSYAEYKTTNEESEIIVVVLIDPDTGAIQAVDRA